MNDPAQIAEKVAWIVQFSLNPVLSSRQPKKLSSAGLMQEVWLRRRANDHKDALRLILEPRFQINAVDPPIDVPLGTFTKEIEPR